MKWLKANFAIFGIMLSVSATGSSTPADDNQYVEVTSYPALTMDSAHERDRAGINEKLGQLIKEKKQLWQP